jgi:hypothetical protein
MELHDIPRNKTKNFPSGISEQEFDTPKEAHAFTHGITYADDEDVECTEPFERNGKFVVRVRIGNFGDD